MYAAGVSAACQSWMSLWQLRHWNTVIQQPWPTVCVCVCVCVRVSPKHTHFVRAQASQKNNKYEWFVILLTFEYVYTTSPRMHLFLFFCTVTHNANGANDANDALSERGRSWWWREETRDREETENREPNTPRHMIGSLSPFRPADTIHHEWPAHKPVHHWDKQTPCFYSQTERSSCTTAAEWTRRSK